MKLLAAVLVLPALTLFAEPIGLVLSGGGAKGAYEVGVWKAMAETGLTRDVRVISGTSIGAVNGALFASVVDPAKVESIWLRRVGKLMGPFVDNIGADVQNRLDAVANEMRLKEKFIEEEKRKLAAEHGVPVEDLLPSEIEGIERAAGTRLSSGLAKQAIAVADRPIEVKPVDERVYRRTLDEALPGIWPEDAPKVYVTTLIKQEQRTKVFLLNEETRSRRLDAIAASSAFPGLFKSVMIDGTEYIDGGVTSEGGDNTPIRPILLKHPEIKTIIVVYLDDEKRLGNVRIRTDDHPGKKIIEIIPSRDSQGLIGCIDSDVENTKSLIALGYKDAISVLKSVERAIR